MPSETIASPEETKKRVRFEDDAYYTPKGVCSAAMGWLKDYLFRRKEYLADYDFNPETGEGIDFIEPCVGAGNLLGEMFEFFPDAKVLTSDIQAKVFDPLLERYLNNDATLMDTWTDFGNKLNTDRLWITVTNPPFNQWVPIFENSVESTDMTLFLLPINCQEPCQKGEGKRDHALKDYSDYLVLQGLFNPRPRFRKDSSGTAARTVGWFCWDSTFDPETQPLLNPFRYFTNWKKVN